MTGKVTLWNSSRDELSGQVAMDSDFKIPSKFDWLSKNCCPGGIFGAGSLNKPQ